MPIGLKNYGKNQKKHKEDIKQSRLLLAEVDVSKVKHDPVQFFKLGENQVISI